MIAGITAALQKVQQARTTLLLDQPFFGVLALSLLLLQDDSCETAWTDGKTLGFNPAYVLNLNSDQLTGLIAHEVMHCACGHPWRRDGRDAKRWNVATDYAINSVLTAAGLTLPDGGLVDSQYDGKHAEWIYDRLPVPVPEPEPEPDPNGTPDGTGPSTGQNPAGEVRDAPTDTDAPTEQEWQQNAAQAGSTGKGVGSDGLAAQITAALRPRTDWRSLLRRYVQEVSKADYSWTRPNVRYIPIGLYLPALHSQSCGPLAIAIDTSGSIDDVLLGQFASEVQSIADELQPSTVTVMYCDTRIHRTDVYEQGQPIDIHCIGRGGTSFEPVFQQLETADVPPACLIYFTDLDGSFPELAPEYPVIWAASTDRRTAPFGNTVFCE